MALTQSARLAGPSWDEEVVPALRKRLQSESRTLARRLSAISLSSIDDNTNANYSAYSDRTTIQQQSPPPSTSSHQSYSSGGQRSQPTNHHLRQPSDRTMYAAPSRVVNGSPKPQALAVSSNFPRARTYSSPYAAEPNGNARPKFTTKLSDPSRSLSPRPVDVKPTRIPKVSRPSPAISASGTSPYMNGYGHSTPAVTPSQSPELPYQQPVTTDQYGVLQRGGTVVPSSSTRSTIELPRSNSGHRNLTPGILNEAPPFPTDSTMSSGFSQHGHGYGAFHEEEMEDPPRASMESEERPFEHWYRGEVSRNGGVGELRVGRRQEMLDIANYGHSIGNKKPSLKGRPLQPAVDENRGYPRKRAGSIAGMTNKERERGSLYLDDEHANQIGRVLDENPLTDLEGEDEEGGSDTHSISDSVVRAYAYLPGVDDIPSHPSDRWASTAGPHEARSTTPTALPRPSSRQTQNPPPTRIPGPSSRQSSESRSTVNTTSIPTPSGIHRGVSEPPQTYTQTMSSSSKTPSPPPVAPSASSNPRQQTPNGNLSASTSSTPQKRGASPAGAASTKKSRTAAHAASTARNKGAAAARREEALSRSVAYYPDVGGDEDMADAIPSWTQPVPKQGNWDEVVLPVVARQKGLDGHYENADGSPQPKKVNNAIEPAPGTFGYDHSKYRPPRNNDEFIPMDEFGRPAEEQKEEDKGLEARYTNRLNSTDDGRDVPVWIPPSPSPAPFSHYAPSSVQVRVGEAGSSLHHKQQEQEQRMMEEELKGGGCCKCVVM